MSEKQAGRQGKWTEDDALRMLANPASIMGLDPDYPGIVSEDQWVRANANAIRDVGPERWLQALLEVLRA